MEWGNASDITSAGCNIIMASAAIYAAYNAKSWFSQRSHTKGFDKAEEIIAKIDNYVRFANGSLADLKSTFETLDGITNWLAQPDINLKKKYGTLAEEHRLQNILIEELKEEVNLIERWSIKVKNKSVIDINLRLLSLIHTFAHDTYLKASTAIDYITNKSKSDFDEIFTEFKGNFNNFQSNLDYLNNVYEEFKGKKFTFFFKVK